MPFALPLPGFFLASEDNDLSRQVSHRFANSSNFPYVWQLAPFGHAFIRPQFIKVSLAWIRRIRMTGKFFDCKFGVEHCNRDC
ncbi:MAG: hypothetical protein JWP89_4787 [Schlesneria sp.]|nr:hypothetical protein [Schlesneria sp.]